MIKIGVLASSGGSVFRAAQEIAAWCHIPVKWVIATDRPCGIEDVAAELGTPCQRLDGDKEEISSKALDYFRFHGVDAVLLFFLRLVTPTLHGAIRTYNIHPSLLPEFPGFHAIRQAMEAKATRLGSTLHLVGETIDGGPIIAQVSTPITGNESEPQLNRLSFFQKTYLTLLFADRLAHGGAVHPHLAAAMDTISRSHTAPPFRFELHAR